MTFSLVASDVEAGQWGVVVASKFLAVGAVVPWAAAGTGAVATQALAKVGFGPDGLTLLRAGHSAQEVVDEAARSRSGRRRSAARRRRCLRGECRLHRRGVCRLGGTPHRPPVRRSGQPAGGAGGDRRRRRDVRARPRGRWWSGCWPHWRRGMQPAVTAGGVSRRAWSCASTAAATAATTSTRSTCGSTTIPARSRSCNGCTRSTTCCLDRLPAEQLLPLEQVESELERAPGGARVHRARPLRAGAVGRHREPRGATPRRPHRPGRPPPTPPPNGVNKWCLAPFIHLEHAEAGA